MSSRQEPAPDSRRYNEAILTALGEYSSSLPNFQIIEIMIFVLGKAGGYILAIPLSPVGIL